jgi:hypothetical protein
MANKRNRTNPVSSGKISGAEERKWLKSGVRSFSFFMIPSIEPAAFAARRGLSLGIFLQTRSCSILTTLLGVCLLAVDCDRIEKNVSAREKQDPTGPLPAVVVPDLDPNAFEFGDPERFALVMAVPHGSAEYPERSISVTVPATAVLHLRNRAWVYVPTGNGRFRRVEVVTGKVLQDNLQEIVQGLDPGTEVVANVLAFENKIEQ